MCETPEWESTGCSFPCLTLCRSQAGHLHGPAEEGALRSPTGAVKQAGATEPPAAAVADAVSYLVVTLQRMVLGPISFLGTV